MAHWYSSSTSRGPSSTPHRTFSHRSAEVAAKTVAPRQRRAQDLWRRRVGQGSDSSSRATDAASSGRGRLGASRAWIEYQGPDPGARSRQTSGASAHRYPHYKCGRDGFWNVAEALHGSTVGSPNGAWVLSHRPATYGITCPPIGPKDPGVRGR